MPGRRERRIAFEVVGRPSRSFLSPTSGAVETLIEVIAAQTGAPPELSTGGGTSDARFIAQYCPVVECGLPGPTMHKADESVRDRRCRGADGALCGVHQALPVGRSVNPLADFSAALRGWGDILTGKPGAGQYFRTTTAGLAVAIITFALAVMLAVAAQSMVVGVPPVSGLLTGLAAQAITVALLGVAIRQSLRYLHIDVALNVLLVPIVYAMAYAFILAVPLNLIGPDAGLLAILGLGFMIFRAAQMLADMKPGLAAALAGLCVLVLVAVPNALYMLLVLLPT